jgi:hypothetical protein
LYESHKKNDNMYRNDYAQRMGLSVDVDCFGMVRGISKEFPSERDSRLDALIDYMGLVEDRPHTTGYGFHKKEGKGGKKRV